jgi:hypothetical protein
MSYFRIVLNGTGIRIRDGAVLNLADVDAEKPIVGFHTTRAVRADSLEAAIEAARKSVLAEWASGRYRGASSGGPPNLIVDETYSDSFFGNLLFRGNGYSFYCDEAD